MVGGRVGVHVPDHPAANNRGYILRSRYVVEQSIGSVLLSTEHVHHKDGNFLNDNLDNLEVMTLASHAKTHGLGNTKKIDRSEVARLRRLGLGCRRIANQIGCDKKSVQRIFIELAL